MLAVRRDSAGTIRLIRYGPNELEERHLELDELGAVARAKGVAWIDCVAPDAAQLLALRAAFDLHPLAIADVAHAPQRPKYAPYSSSDFFVLAAAADADHERIGLFLGEGWVVTVREGIFDPFEPIRERIRGRIGAIRERSAGWLAAALITTIVEGFFGPVERLREELETLEDEVLGNARRGLFGSLHDLRSRILHVRRTIGSTREALLRAVREGSPRWDGDALLHLREASEDASQLLDQVESTQSAAVSLGDLYLSLVSSRTNEVVTLLTLVSTLFLPMTFLTGVWGMNFEAMPELRWRWGYAFAWAAILASALALLAYFQRRNWFHALRGPWADGDLEGARRGAARRRRARRRADQ